MTDLILILIFSFVMFLSLGMFAVFIVCMYLREFPKIKHSIEADLEKNTYKTQTEIDKPVISDIKNDK